MEFREKSETKMAILQFQTCSSIIKKNDGEIVKKPTENPKDPKTGKEILND